MEHICGFQSYVMQEGIHPPWREFTGFPTARPVSIQPLFAMLLRASLLPGLFIILQSGILAHADKPVGLPFIDADQPVTHAWEFYLACHDYAMVIGKDIDRSNVQPVMAQLNEEILDKFSQPKLAELRRKIMCLYLQSGLESQQDKERRNESSVHNVLNRTSVHRMMLDYFERYVYEARNRQYIFHHHISKNSGTAICTILTNAQCEVTQRNRTLPTFGANCWSHWFDDTMYWNSVVRRKKDENYVCEARLDFVKSTGLSVMSNENYLTDDVGKASCSHHHALSINVVRHPLKRTLSHEDEYVHLHTGLTSGCLKNRSIECFWSTVHGDFVSKNYQVKSLAGKSAWIAPETTEEHYQQALANLRSFDILLVIRRQPTSYTVPWETIFHVGLGLFRIRKIAGRERHDKLTFTPDQLAHFLRNNVWDYALFDYAKRLERLDMIGYNRTASLCEIPSNRNVAPIACAAFLHDTEALESLGVLPVTCGWPHQKALDISLRRIA